MTVSTKRPCNLFDSSVVKPLSPQHGGITRSVRELLMTELNADAIVAAGFKVDAAGHVRNAQGQRVKSAVAELVSGGAIIANFDPAMLRKAKARKAVTGGKSLVEMLNEISPAIGLLNPGQTAKLTMPEKVEGQKDPKRSFVMSIVTKLNNLTQADREWAGRVFDCLSDEDGTYFYVTRLADTDTPHKRKPGGGRGKADASKSNLTAALDKAKSHLGGDAEPNPDDAKVQEVAKDAADGKEVVIGQSEGGSTETITEEAQVITH